MKFIAFILFLCVCIEAYAANPTFNSFDTNAFIADPVANLIQANTSSGNPNALVKQSQITAGGISLSQATNVVNGITGVVVTNGVNLTTIFSSTGTNGIKAIATNLNSLIVTNIANFQSGVGISTGYISNGVSMLFGTASTDIELDSLKRVTSLANAAGVKTNNGSGGIGWSQAPTLALSNAITGTLPYSLADATWPVLTNTSLLSGVSNILSYIGNNSSGAPIFSPTNSLSVTNSMTSLTIDFAVDVASTNMSGNVTISSVANLQPTVRNHVIRTFYPNGSDRSFTFASNIHTNPGSVYWCSNAYDHVDLLFTCRQGRDTNVAILPYQ